MKENFKFLLIMVLCLFALLAPFIYYIYDAFTTSEEDFAEIGKLAAFVLLIFWGGLAYLFFGNDIKRLFKKKHEDLPEQKKKRISPRDWFWLLVILFSLIMLIGAFISASFDFYKYLGIAATICGPIGFILYMAGDKTK